MEKVINAFVSEHNMAAIPDKLISYRKVFADQPFNDVLEVVRNDLREFGFGGSWYNCYGNEFVFYRTGVSSGDYIQIALMTDYIEV